MIIDDDNELFDDIESSKSLTLDIISKFTWKTKEGKLIRVRDMADSHLRNTAMMLAGFGYQDYHTSDECKIIWLRVLKMEWDRRMRSSENKA